MGFIIVEKATGTVVGKEIHGTQGQARKAADGFNRLDELVVVPMPNADFLKQVIEHQKSRSAYEVKKYKPTEGVSASIVDKETGKTLLKMTTLLVQKD